MSSRKHRDSDYDDDSDCSVCDKCRKREHYKKCKSKKCDKCKKPEKSKKCKCQENNESDKNVQVKNEGNCITITIKQCS